MRHPKLGRRFLLTLGLTCGLALAIAPLASADIVNLTRFSKTVSGTAPTGTTMVTVYLLRNTETATGTVVRQAVDGFNVAPNGSLAWSGAFVNHAFSTDSDQVEVDYTGATSPTQVTIGGGEFLSTASTAPAEEIDLPADDIDGNCAVESTGADMYCDLGSFTATVNGTAAPAPVGNYVTFTTPVTNASTVLVTETDTGSLGTTVNLTDSAPLLTPLPTGVTGPVISYMSEPSCGAFESTNEVVCQNLTPGSYTLNQVRGGSSVFSGTVTVPAQASANSTMPSYGAAALPSLAGGDQIILSSGTHVLTTLTVRPLTIASATPLGDLLNGSDTTITGTCSPSEFFTDFDDLCSSAGAIPSPNHLDGEDLSLYDTYSDPIGQTLGQFDDTSSGETQVNMPEIPYDLYAPEYGEGVHTPFFVYALSRYDDPTAIAGAVNSYTPTIGEQPVLPSTASSSPVVFQYAQLGSPTFTTLGNVNVAGGIALPALTPGIYDDRYVVTDPHGNTSYYDGTFDYEGNAAAGTPGPAGAAGTAPVGPAAPSCRATANHRRKATIHSTRSVATAAKAKRAAVIRVTLICTASTNNARVAFWLQRGSSDVVADGSGVVRNHKVRVNLSARFKNGNYLLYEVIDSKGLATEAKHTLVLK